MKSARSPKRATPRRGAILVLVGILLVVILGMVACALDVGWIVMTRTQLQAAADASALAAGTELLSGLGYKPTRLPPDVILAGTPVAVDFAARHRNGDVAASFADGPRDVQFGWATFTADTALSGTGTTGTWAFVTAGQTGTGWYNAARVTLHRDVPGSTNGDSPLSLILAPVLGRTTSDVTARATAIIMPTRGFVIEPASGESANILPFALYSKFWEKYWRAQKYYEANPTMDLNNLTTLQTIPDPEYPSEPLFGTFAPAPNPNDPPEFKQLFADNWLAGSDPEAAYANPVPTSSGDKVLEFDAYPHDYAPGNFGLLDLGSGNQNKEINNQIIYGVNEGHLANLGLAPGEEFTPQGISPVTGTAGIRTEMQTVVGSPLLSIIGQCRSMLLFTNDISTLGTGTNTSFDLSDLAGVRILDVKLTGNMDLRNITIQLCKFSMPGAVADFESEIGEDTTVFTPLMLIE
ncbi:MAG: pilus assembly protein TadG-related protein [Pirellulaceae bacterium]